MSNDKYVDGLPKLWDIEQVAEYYHRSTVTIWSWTKKNLLKSYKIGRRVYYKVPEVTDGLIQITGK